MTDDLRDRLFAAMAEHWEVVSTDPRDVALMTADVNPLLDRLMPLIEDAIDEALREGAEIGAIAALANRDRARYLNGGAQMTLHEPDAAKAMRIVPPESQ